MTESYKNHPYWGDVDFAPFWTIKKCREYINQVDRKDVIKLMFHHKYFIDIGSVCFNELDAYKWSEELLLTQMDANMLHRTEWLINAIKYGLQRWKLKHN